MVSHGCFVNPRTGRAVVMGGRTHRKLARAGAAVPAVSVLGKRGRRQGGRKKKRARSEPGPIAGVGRGRAGPGFARAPARKRRRAE